MRMKNAVKRMDVVIRWVKGIRDRWMLLAFVVSVALWVEDIGRVYVALPELLEQRAQAIEALEQRVGVLEHRVDRALCPWPRCARRDAGSAI
ncbi:MAG: hypothetical protein AAGE80_10470 [Pseudomonadota bacterium]